MSSEDLEKGPESKSVGISTEISGSKIDLSGEIVDGSPKVSGTITGPNNIFSFNFNKKH